MFRKILKWVGITLGGLVGLLAAAFAILFFIGGAKIGKTYDVPVETVAVPTDAQAVQRGEHLATILLCKRCHGDSLGGQVYFDAPGLLTIPSPNLTSGKGGVGGTYTDEDWSRAILHGIGKDGRGLFFMLSPAFRQYGKQDIGALIAYLKTVPPVDNELPGRRFEPIANVMMGAGAFPPLPADTIDHTAQIPVTADVETSQNYGEVLSSTCRECHGAKLNGMPFGPPGQQSLTPNLTPGGELGSWSEEEFAQTLRTGVTPTNRRLSEEMPWKYYGKMSDAEFKSLWLYLHSLPALEQGK